MTTALVTGAGRGIGLEICRLLAERGADVYATVRTPTDQLRELDLKIIEGIDVGDDQVVGTLRGKMAGVALNLLINNAGILTSESFDSLEFDRMRQQFEINALGPLRVIRALESNLVDGAKVGIVTSRVGSIGDNGRGGYYGYRMSKAAANMAGRNLSHDLAGRSIAVALLHPGLVATEMTGHSGISPVDAARGLIARMDALDMDSTGAFWHAEGYELPW